MCFVMGVVGYQLAYSKGQLFREGVFQFMTSFSLPWYVIVREEVGVQVGLPIWGSLALRSRSASRSACWRRTAEIEVVVLP